MGGQNAAGLQQPQQPPPGTGVFLEGGGDQDDELDEETSRQLLVSLSS